MQRALCLDRALDMRIWTSFILLASPVSCEVFDLENSAPWLVVGRNRVTFSLGWDAFVVADSACVRVNSRGVYSKPSHWTARRLHRDVWTSRKCAPGGGGGLCDTGMGVVFPDSASPPVYNASRAWGGLQCTRPTDGRVLDNQYGYDVSACDVLDEGGDIVLCGRDLSFARTKIVDGVYWVLCLIAVYIVRSLSYLVVKKMTTVGDQPSPNFQWSDAWTVVLCLAALPLCLVPLGDAGFVTDEEAFFFDFLCIYCASYAVLFAVHAWAKDERDPPVYNLIAATVQVIACRLYLSAETPYNPVIMWAISTRALAKMRCKSWGGLVLGLSTLADAYLLALMCMISFEHNRLYLAAVMTLSMTTSDTLVGH